MRPLVLTGIVLLSGCSQMATSAEAICGLEPELPTVSREDTDQTIIEVANFNGKFRAGCGVESSRKPQ